MCLNACIYFDTDTFFFFYKVERCYLDCSGNVKTKNKIKLIFVFFWTRNKNREEISLSLYRNGKKGACMSTVGKNHITDQTNSEIQAIYKRVDYCIFDLYLCFSFFWRCWIQQYFIGIWYLNSQAVLPKIY